MYQNLSLYCDLSFIETYTNLEIRLLTMKKNETKNILSSLNNSNYSI